MIESRLTPPCATPSSRRLLWPLGQRARSLFGSSIAAVALFTTACGGGGSDTTPAVQPASITVMGDSLADSGTFGYKFTVQGADSRVFPEIIARSYGLAAPCNVYAFTGTTFVANTVQTGCSNFAVGGGRINNFSAPTSPQSIVQQITSAGAAASAAGGYSAGALLVIDGGANDAADLVGAFLAVPRDGGASYAALLGTVLPPTTIGPALAQGQAGLESLGATYLAAVADRFFNAIKTNALDKGAQRIVVVNMPGITNTPRFQTVLDSIAASAGGGSTGTAARAHYESVFKGWIVAFNTELAQQFSGNAKVIVVDFYTSFNDEIATPAQFGLQNVSLPVCPITGLGSDGLPTYTFPTCTDVSLSATAPPAGATGGANWWKSFAFSDSFHPTPYGHQLLAQLISRSLSQAGWL